MHFDLLNVCTFIYTLTISFLFFRKKRVKSTELTIFSFLLVISMCSLMCEQGLIFLVGISGTFFYTILLKLLLVFYYIWTSLFLLYTVSI